MGFVGSEPSQANVSSAGILDGAIVNADINASAAIAMSKTAFSDGTGLTLSTNTLNIDAAQTGITSLLATDIKIGEDDQTKIDFEDTNKINFYANNAKEVELAENSLSPGTSDGTALGTTSLMWSDLFLASGSVINFNNGDVTLTHSGNTLTVAGGTLATATITASTSIDITGSAGLILENDETITNSTNGTVLINGIVAGGTGSGAGVFQSNGDHDVTLQTGNSTTGTITITDGANGDVAIAPNGTGKLTSTGDIDVFRDANDADVALRLGTAAAESLTIQVLNGGSNKTAEEVHFSSATASATGDHGKMVFDIDGTDILTIDDGGLVIKTTGTIGPVGDEDLVTLTASGSIVTVAGELSVTTLDIGGTDVTSTAAELNILDGVNTTASELNLLDGSAKSTSSITLADADAFIVIDGSTTKQIPASDISTYIGGGGGSFTATADGAISAGDLVALKTDGDIEKCEAIQAGKAFGTFASQNATEIENATTYYASAGFDPDNNKIAVGYRDSGNSNYPTLAMGKVDNAANHTLSFGTPVVIESTAATNPGEPNLPYDTNVDRFVYCWGNSSGIRAVVFCIDNATTHTITKGSVQTVDNSARGQCAVFDPNANRVLVAYEDTDDSQKLIAQAFTVRGSTDNDIQDLGAKLEITANTATPAVCFDSNDNKVMIVYRETTDSNYPYARALTIDNSDNSITGGTAVRLDNSTQITSMSQPPALVHDSAKNQNLWMHQGYSGGMDFLPFTSASGSITAGTRSHLANTELSDSMEIGSYVTAQYDPDAAKIVIFSGYSGMWCFVGSLSGSGSSLEFTVDAKAKLANKNGATGGGYVSYLACCYDTNDNKHFLTYTSGTSNTGLFGLLPIVPLNADKFIGFANDAISNDASGTVTTTGGIATGQSSLTIGSEYYVTAGGELSTTSGTVFAGKALSATTILVNSPRVDAT